MDGREHYSTLALDQSRRARSCVTSRLPVRVGIGLPVRSSYVVTGAPNPSGSNAEGTKAMAQGITAEMKVVAAQMLV